MKKSRTKPIAYVFGYGSLMYPSGINGRGLWHKYTWEDLSPTKITGYKRGLFASFAHLNFYGLMADPSKTTNGVLLPIFSKRDLNVLWINEGATKQYSMYKVKEVGKDTQFTHRFLKAYNVPVFTLTNVIDKSSKGITPPWYIANVWRGIKPWGPGFRSQFINTGGVKPNCVTKMASSIYDLCKPARYIWRNLLKIN